MLMYHKHSNLQCGLCNDNFHNHSEYILTSESNHQCKEKSSKRLCFHISQTFPCGLFNLTIKFICDSTQQALEILKSIIIKRHSYYNLFFVGALRRGTGGGVFDGNLHGSLTFCL